MGKRSGCGGFPAFYRTFSPAKKASWLVGDDCKAMIDQGRLSQSNVMAEVSNLERRRNQVRQLVPSPARLDDYEGGEQFPPGGEKHTTMRRARWMLNQQEELVYWPGHYVDDDGATFDLLCLEDEQRRRRLEGIDFGNTSSHTGMVIQRLAEESAELVELKLDPDDEGALQREIDDYLTGQNPLAFTFTP